MTAKNPNLQVHTIVPALNIEPESASNVLVGLHMNPKLRLISTSISTIMHFGVRETNLSTGKVISDYTDEY